MVFAENFFDTQFPQRRLWQKAGYLQGYSVSRDDIAQG